MYLPIQNMSIYSKKYIFKKNAFNNKIWIETARNIYKINTFFIYTNCYFILVYNLNTKQYYIWIYVFIYYFITFNLTYECWGSINFVLLYILFIQSSLLSSLYIYCCRLRRYIFVFSVICIYLLFLMRKSAYMSNIIKCDKFLKVVRFF